MSVSAENDPIESISIEIDLGGDFTLEEFYGGADEVPAVVTDDDIVGAIESFRSFSRFISDWGLDADAQVDVICYTRSGRSIHRTAFGRRSNRST